jgi:hypothetical protein
MGGHFDGSGVTDNHAIWAGFGILAGFIFKANGWAEKDPVTGKWIIWWTRFGADLTSASAIYMIALGLTALAPNFGVTVAPATTALLVLVMFLFGLRPLAAKLQEWVDALIARVKGGAS